MVQILLAKRFPIELMNCMSSPAGLRVCVKGWRVIQTAETAGKGVHNLPSVDPILYLNSFFNSANQEEGNTPESNMGDEEYRFIYIAETTAEKSDDKNWIDMDGKWV